METILLVVHLMVAIALIAIILIQRSEGGGLGLGGGGGGGGGPGNLISVRGAANFLTRTTAFLAVAFFSTSLILAILAGEDRSGGAIVTDPVDEAPAEPVEEPPVIPTTD